MALLFCVWFNKSHIFLLVFFGWNQFYRLSPKKQKLSCKHHDHLDPKKCAPSYLRVCIGCLEPLFSPIWNSSPASLTQRWWSLIYAEGITQGGSLWHTFLTPRPSLIESVSPVVKFLTQKRVSLPKLKPPCWYSYLTLDSLIRAFVKYLSELGDRVLTGEFCHVGASTWSFAFEILKQHDNLVPFTMGHRNLMNISVPQYRQWWLSTRVSRLVALPTTSSFKSLTGFNPHRH